MDVREENGTVITAGPVKAEVRLDGSSPQACASCGCSMCSGTGSNVRTMEVESNGLKKGDRVVVKVPQRSGYVSLLIVFVLPMVLFLAGMLGAMQLVESSGVPVLAGLLGLMGGFCLAGLLDRYAFGGRSVEVHPVGKSSPASAN